MVEDIIGRYPIWKSDPISLPLNVKINYKWDAENHFMIIDIYVVAVESLSLGSPLVKVPIHFYSLR